MSPTFKPFRDGSRANWGATQEGYLTLEQINAGALLRIADATERIPEALASQIARLIDRCVSAEAALKTERQRNAAYRGIIRRVKNGGRK